MDLVGLAETGSTSLGVGRVVWRPVILADWSVACPMAEAGRGAGGAAGVDPATRPAIATGAGTTVGLGSAGGGAGAVAKDGAWP